MEKENSKDMIIEEPKEPNKEEIQKKLKENILKIYKQIKTGCCRKICYNIFCAKNILCKKKYENASNETIFKDIMKIQQEMTNKYSYDNWDKIKCDENELFLNLEKKFDIFSIDKGYNYATNMALNKIELPEINLDLAKIISYYKKSESNSTDDLIKEIASFNDYLKFITKNINLKKVETLREKSVLYYLFYFMSRAFFYIVMNNNFMFTKENAKEFIGFFGNFRDILNITKLYIKEDLLNSKNDNIINETEKISKKINLIIFESFKCLKNYPNEFKDAIISCQNFLILILFSEETEENPFGPPRKFLTQELSNLLEIIVVNLDFFYKLNKNYSIINYQNFYNDGVCKRINLKYEFRNYLNNEKIRKRMRREKKKEKEKENNKDKKEEKNMDIEDDKESEDDENEILGPLAPLNLFEKKDTTIKFTLLDYMWLFNPASKNEIIILFNEQKKQKEFIKSVHQAPGLFGFPLLVNAKDVFLTINIRRNNLIEDALNELSRNDIKLQNPIKVKFIGEQGVDEGGVRKEFFLLFIRQIFDPNYGMFNYNSKTRLYWFNHYTFEPKIKYELIGIIFGLAIYNNIILDVKFPITVYRKLLGLKPTLEDMKECDPELYKNLKFLRETKDENLKDDLDSDFTVVDDKFGEKIIINLKENGNKIQVDINNKDEYVELYLDWYFTKSIQEVFTSFEKGFYRVFSRDLSKILSPEELELIICGTQTLDFHELKRVCRYEEYTKDSETIKQFWEVLLEFDEEEKKKFLSFVTGCDRAPIDGLGSLPITISNGGTDIEQLPSAHTCFNNLILPNYKNKEKLKKNLLIAINYSEGFGLI